MNPREPRSAKELAQDLRDGELCLPVISNAAQTAEKLKVEERQRRENEIRELIIAGAAEGICVHHEIDQAPFIRFTVWNERMTDITGYTVDEMNRIGWLEAMYPDAESREAARLRMERARNGEDLRSREIVLRNKDGTLRTVLISSRLLTGQAGNRQTLVLLYDITQQCQAEEAVRESQRMLFTLIENLPGMAYRARNDAHWTMEFISDRCREITGYSAYEIIGNRVIAYERLIHPEDRSMVRSSVDSALDARKPFEVRYRIVSRDGTIRWVWERGSGVFDSAGNISFIEGFVSDVTAQKKLEEEFRQSQKMESIGRLAGGVAHDFNNMLTVIQGHSLLISDTPGLPDSVRASIKEIAVAVERAANLTRQLLTFSRRQLMQRRDLDLNGVVSDTLNMLGRVLGEDIALEFNPSTQPALVRGDSGMLQQVIMNLAVNARDAMPNGGKLTLRVRYSHASVADPESTVFLDVADTGVGIAPEHLPRIFEPFFTTKDVGKGTGLGLATVYGIIDQHRGRISVESVVGKGTQFLIQLPALLTPGTPEPVKRGPQAMRGGHETIFVVEDEAPVLALVQQVLGNLGYKTLIAESGALALNLWNQRGAEVDLLLTDLVMPDGISGRELAERLREKSPALKTIFTSGYSPEVLGKDFILQRGQSFLQKPYSPADLARVVRECLDAR